MIVEFEREELKAFYTGVFKGKPKFNDSVLHQYRKAINLFRSAENFNALKSFSSLRVHKLKDDLSGKWSASVNMQYRIVFSLKEEKIQIILIENLTDYH